MALFVLRNLEEGIDTKGVYLPECISVLNLERECEQAKVAAENTEPVMDLAILNEMMGDHHFDLGNVEQSLHYYKEALSLLGAAINPSLFLMIGKCYHLLGKFEKAENYLFLAFNMMGNDSVKGNESFFGFLDSSQTQIA